MKDFELEIGEQNFKGPIELLFELIEKRKLLIHDISLAKVADDFISYIEKLGSFPVSEAAQFLAIASTLLLIKSRSLLPNLTLTTDEEEDAKNLERRLFLYARMRELSKYIKDKWCTEPSYDPLPRKDIKIFFAPSKNISLNNLKNAFEHVINLIPESEKKDTTTVRKVISLEQVIISLGDRLTKAMNISFSNLAKEHGGSKSGHRHVLPKEERKNLIVTFLALLELVKRGAIEAMQENSKADIMLGSKTLNTPQYGTSVK